MYNKYIVILIAAALTLTLPASCAKNAENPPAPESTTAAPASVPYSLSFKRGESAVWFVEAQNATAEFSRTLTADSLIIEKINESLASFYTESLAAFLSEADANRQTGWDFTETPELFYCGERYVSVGYYLRQTHDRGVNKVFFYNTTVDLQTGEVVKLSDLIDINAEFIGLIKSGEIIDAMHFRGGGNGDALSLDERRERIIERFAGIDDEVFAARLDEASKSYAESPPPPYGKCSFYIIPGNLVIDHIIADGENGYPSRYEIRLNLDNIERFIKVPKW